MGSGSHRAFSLNIVRGVDSGVAEADFTTRQWPKKIIILATVARKEEVKWSAVLSLTFETLCWSLDYQLPFPIKCRLALMVDQMTVISACPHRGPSFSRPQRRRIIDSVLVLVRIEVCGLGSVHHH